MIMSIELNRPLDTDLLAAVLIARLHSLLNDVPEKPYCQYSLNDSAGGGRHHMSHRRSDLD